MAKISNGATFGVTKKQMQAVRLMADGHKLEEIAICLFDVLAEDGVTVDAAKLDRAKRKLVQWRGSDKVQQAFRALLREDMMQPVARAARKLSEQIEDGNGWLANKAANDVLTRFGPAVLGEESKQIVVRVEGMPELGAPEIGEQVTSADVDS